MRRSRKHVQSESLLYSYEYEVAYDRLLRRVYNGFHMLDPLLRRLPPIETEHHHGAVYTGTQPSTTQNRSLGSEVSDEINNFGEPLELHGGTHRFRATAYFHPSDINIEAHTEFLLDIAQAYVASMRPITEQHCRDVAKAHGNCLETNGESLSWDHLLTMVEGMRLDFDEQGRVIWPLLLLENKVEDSITILLEKSPATSEQQQKLEKIIEEKRQEFNARKCTRRLSRQSAR